MPEKSKPHVAENESHHAANFRELARYQRGEVVRIYTLRRVENGAELWRVTEKPGAAPESIQETTFCGAEEALQFLEELERTLRAGGWTAT